MKKDIHPAYNEVTVVCGCGNTFQTRSTRTERIAIEICSNCHPFYTGKQKYLDTAGMIEKFQRKWSSDTAKTAKDKADALTSKAKAADGKTPGRSGKTLQSQLPGPGPASLAPAVSQKAARTEHKPDAGAKPT